MLYAKTKDGQLIRPNKKDKDKGIKAYCPFCNWPICNSPLRYNFGKVKTNYFSHPPEANCDPWSRGKETEWHRSWKEFVKKEHCEVTVKKNGERHRADIVNQNGLVIELQNSPISISEIHERELFYKNMIWLFNGRKSRIIVHKNPHASYGWPNDCKLIVWKNIKKTLLHARKRIFIDLGNENILFLIKNINGLYWVEDGKKRKTFAGYVINQNDFIDYFFKEKKSLVFECIHDSLAEDTGCYFEQQLLFFKYFKWLFNTKKNYCPFCLETKEKLFNHHFSDSNAMNSVESHRWTVTDFIVKYPQYKDNDYFLLKTIKLGMKLGWYKMIDENKLKYT